MAKSGVEYLAQHSGWKTRKPVRRKVGAAVVRIKKSQREEIRKLVQNAVSIQVQLYNALGEIEAVTGLLSGLDDAVRHEASDWINPEDVKIDDSTLNGIFADVRREK